MIRFHRTALPNSSTLSRVEVVLPRPASVSLSLWCTVSTPFVTSPSISYLVTNSLSLLESVPELSNVAKQKSVLSLD